MDEGCWAGVESLLHIFVPGVTQGNEDPVAVQPLPLFSIFQEPSTITEVIEEIFEVNINEDIEDMDLFDLTQ